MGRGRRMTAARTTDSDAGRMYGGEPLETRRRDQRERVLAAAREVFAERGYVHASIDAIVSRARVSRTAFYRFFDNKEQCLLAIFDEAMGQLGGTLEAVAPPPGP